VLVNALFMTPLEFLRLYEFDERVSRGGYFPSSPLDVEEGDRVGIVLLGAGGPSGLEEVRSFLYNLYMDPVRVDLPVGGRVRHWLSAALSWFQEAEVRSNYELIGGRTPLTRLAREQAESLQRRLQNRYGTPTGVDFRTYVAMRYCAPYGEEAAIQMKEDAVDKVVLLPLSPQYGKTTTGSHLAYWNALDATGEIPSWPTTSVVEYAANPKYIQAVSERIDEGLQRFDRNRRDEVHLLFSAHGVPRNEEHRRRDPYCCLTHATVEQVMRHRGSDHSFDIAFRDTFGPGKTLAPSTSEALERLAEEGTLSVLVVPVSHAADHFDTSYTLDIEKRREARRLGIERYEVTSGLNTHPLFVEALSEAAIAQLALPVDANQLRMGDNGAAPDYQLCPPSEARDLGAGDRELHCPDCPGLVEIRLWRNGERAPDEKPAEKNAPLSSGSPS